MSVCMYGWMDACMHARMQVCVLFICVCVLIKLMAKTKNVTRKDMQSILTHQPGTWRKRQVSCISLFGGAEVCRRTTGLRGPVVVRSRGPNSMEPNFRADRINHGLSQSLNRINLSQEIHRSTGSQKMVVAEHLKEHPYDMGCIHPIVSPWNGWSHAPASFVGYISASVTSHEIQEEIPIKINDWSVTVLRHLPKLLGHEPSSFQASQGFWSFSALGPGLLIPLGGRLDQAGSWIGNHNR